MFSRYLALPLALLMISGQGGQGLADWQAGATAQLAAQHQCALVFLDELLSNDNRTFTATGHCADGRTFVVELESGREHFLLTQVGRS